MLFRSLAGNEQAIHKVCYWNGGNYHSIEPDMGGNAWSHPTWDHRWLAYFNNPDDTVDVLNYSVDSLLQIPMRDIWALTKKKIYSNYQHGDFRDGRLCFSMKDKDGIVSIAVYDLADETMTLITDGIKEGPSSQFYNHCRPSISEDGSLIAYHSVEGVKVIRSGL